MKKKIKDLQVKIKTNNGEEGWMSMTELSRTFIETIKDLIELTIEEIEKKQCEKYKK